MGSVKLPILKVCLFYIDKLYRGPEIFDYGKLPKSFSAYLKIFRLLFNLLIA